MSTLNYKVISLSKTLIKTIKGNAILMVIAGSIVGFLAALFIFFFEELPFIPENAFIPCSNCGISKTEGVLNKYPKFFTWIMLFVIHTSATLGLGLVALRKVIEKSIKRFSVTNSEIIISLILVLLMMVSSSSSYVFFFNSGQYYFWPESPLNHQWIKIIILVTISVISASISVLGMILTGCSCMKFNVAAHKEKMVYQYFELKEEMERYLLITGYILSSGMLAVFFFAATQESMNLKSRFDIHALTIYGLLFTIFIATSFIPCKFLLADFGRKIVDVHMGSPPHSGEELKKWLETSDSLEKYLQLKFELLETIKYSIPILSPILSAFIPTLFSQ